MKKSLIFTFCLILLGNQAILSEQNNLSLFARAVSAIHTFFAPANFANKIVRTTQEVKELPTIKANLETEPNLITFVKTMKENSFYNVVNQLKQSKNDLEYYLEAGKQNLDKIKNEENFSLINFADMESLIKRLDFQIQTLSKIQEFRNSFLEYLSSKLNDIDVRYFKIYFPWTTSFQIKNLRQEFEEDLTKLKDASIFALNTTSEESIQAIEKLAEKINQLEKDLITLKDKMFAEEQARQTRQNALIKKQQEERNKLLNLKPQNTKVNKVSKISDSTLDKNFDEKFEWTTAACQAVHLEGSTYIPGRKA
ncbi:TPA: hypothetical protein DEO28_04195 [Candidatus Dependentiae bacterium]|nr:MAG: hypothetical protein UR14_C0006G0075 [candidate division TM6 bacterium GW2011_GWE2_31_21]KKP53502.1 MAG: hypothetical protein UR43_C0004G0043 [candidate division TM6 bacterium GW2011_GWF2_33_332]HBS48258.1 hypothetical protein [Candidatus Dependentiae bacterium]HBZ73684.1 hypothetical protein [Candidatus Dependentiae bacterium]